jgi:hypothetical protein
VRPVWVTGLARLGLELGLRRPTRDAHPDPYDGQSSTSISPQGCSPSLVSLCGNTVNQPRARESPCAQGKWRTVAYQAGTYSTSTTPRPLSFGSSTRTGTLCITCGGAPPFGPLSSHHTCTYRTTVSAILHACAPHTNTKTLMEIRKTVLAAE